MNWKRSWPDPSEQMPIDFYPVSNGEYIPAPPEPHQHAIMALQEQEGERIRRKLGMTRRDFVRSAAAMSVGMWAFRHVLSGGRAGAAEDCLDDPTVQLSNLPGEFIFDIQTHHVDEDGLWKVTNPGFHAFFAAVWPQSNCGELDRMQCLGSYHYIKEVYMESATTMGVLSAVPSSPDRNPLPTQTAADTVMRLNEIAASQRAVMHAFVMPNRGHAWAANLADQNGLFLQDELNEMTRVKELYPFLRAWKCYTPWGDVPNASGWFHDDRSGRAMIQHAIDIGLPVIATHKGFALPSFDQRSAACRDIGPVARDYYDPDDDTRSLKVIVYHSGFDSETVGPYAGDENVDSAVDRGIDSLIKSLRENGWSARHFASGGTPGLAGAAGEGDPSTHANVPNVYAEIGSTWRTVWPRSNRAQAAHLLGKLIYHVGPKRVVWGTDSLWYGSPQPEIAALRDFPWGDAQVQQILAEQYNLPYGIDGDVDDPTQLATDPKKSIRNGIFGRNAAVPYQVDPDAAVNKITCDGLTGATNEEYLTNVGTLRETKPLAANTVHGPRTASQLFASIYPNKPWSP